MKQEITLADGEVVRHLSGVGERRLREFRRLFRVEATLRGSRLLLNGEAAAVARASGAAREIIDRLASREEITEEEFGRIIERHLRSSDQGRDDARALILPGGRRVSAITAGQATYVEAMRECDVSFCVGVAGTGKTYLAVAAALEALGRGAVIRIVIVRPVVEAGEHLGFLPGDLREKVSPYLRPITDALAEMTSFRQMEKYLERGVVEIAPLAYMRGRTLSRVFAVLDEAQNTTEEQMKMFLTRLGPSSMAVITGDVTQIDLPDKRKSGLLAAREALTGVPGIAFVHLTEADIVRHPLVRAIVDAWARREKKLGKS